MFVRELNCYTDSAASKDEVDLTLKLMFVVNRRTFVEYSTTILVTGSSFLIVVNLLISVSTIKAFYNTY